MLHVSDVLNSEWDCHYCYQHLSGKWWHRSQNGLWWSVSSAALDHCGTEAGRSYRNWQCADSHPLLLGGGRYFWMWRVSRRPGLELTVIFDFTVFPLGLTWNENPTGNIEPEAAAVRVCRQRAANVVMNHRRLEFHRLFAIWFNVSSRILMNGLHSWHSDWINQRNIITVEIDVQLKTRITKLSKDKKVKYTLSYNYKGSMWIKSRDDSSKSSSFMFCCPLCPLCSLDCYCPLLAVQWYQPVVHHVDIEPVLSSAQWVSCALMFVYTLNMHCVLPQWVHTVYTAHNSLTSCFYNTVQW